MYPVIYLATELSGHQYLNCCVHIVTLRCGFNGYAEMGSIMRNGL